MKRKIKNIIIGSVSLLTFSLPMGCNTWLDIAPENEQTTDNYWKTKEEVQEILMGGYSMYRKQYRKYIQWGELRGDGLMLGGDQDASEKKIKELNINYENSICKWSDFYTVIGRANSVIEYAPSVLDKDITFTEQLSNSYVAEAVFIRALCYFHLVRTFRDVPLVIKAYVDDSEEYYIPKSSEEDILNFLVSNLEEYIKFCKYKYDTEWETKGRATRWAYHALIADIALWKGDYDKCKFHCDEILTGNEFSLVATEEYYTLFYPGNSVESIFEIQWDKDQYDQSNDLFKWFYDGKSNSNYLISESTRELFEGDLVTDIDFRGPGNAYVSGGDYDGKIWKYAGTGMYGLDETVERNSDMQDANWIVYRLTEIYLMKAEAHVMQGDFDLAKTLIKDIRTRAGLTVDVDMSTERSALIVIQNERQKEFIGEGKRWYDILRMARRNDFTTYKNDLIEILLAGVEAKDRDKWVSLLSDEDSYYLPIHKDDIENSEIEQNPYYKDQE